jgi:hypothetical protein
MFHRLSASSLSPALLVGSWALGACGGAPPPIDAPAAEAHRPGETGQRGEPAEGMSAMGETGALSQADVQATFQRALPAMNRCVAGGRKRLPFLSGDITVHLQINAMGKAAVASLTDSTLGDQQVEACILDVLRAQQWPRPVGGKVGETTQSMGFSRDPDEEAPLAWTAQVLAEAMAADLPAEEGSTASSGSAPSGAAPFAELRGKLDRCRTEAGASRLQVTLYLDEDGLPQGVGLASPDPGGRAALECVKTVVETTSFPSPRSNFAKMTLSVP